MNKTTALKIVNPLLAVLLLGQVSTGVLHGLMPREVFELLHLWGGLLLGAVAVLHLSLNWGWVKGTFFR